MNKVVVIIFLVYLPRLVVSQDVSLSGTYRIDVTKLEDLMEARSRSMYDSLPMNVRADALKSIGTRQFHFCEDGQLQVSWGIAEKAMRANGTWIIRDGDSNKLLLTVDGEQKEYLISEQSQHYLILNNTQGTGLFNILYLLKIE